MLEIAPKVYYITGKNKSRFPYCACLYLEGRDVRILIDAGMGGSRLEPFTKKGIDLLLLTHCHIDHRLTRREIPDVPVGCHAAEVPYLRDKDRFLEGTGFSRSGLALDWMYEKDHRLFDVDVARTLADGERIDLGGLTLEAVSTPGHSPGHLSFFIPEHNLLFSGDVDLTSFGPFYGHDFADIDAFTASIRRLKRLGAKTVVSGHGGPFTDYIARRFDRYAGVIGTREKALVKALDRPRTIDELVGRGIVYRRFHDDTPYGDLSRWFERIHIEKHLDRLAAEGRAGHDPDSDRWFLIENAAVGMHVL